MFWDGYKAGSGFIGAVALLAVARLAVAVPVSPSTPAVAATPEVAALQTRLFTVRYVKAYDFAWWLDPAHNVEPEYLREAGAFRRRTGGPSRKARCTGCGPISG